MRSSPSKRSPRTYASRRRPSTGGRRRSAFRRSNWARSGGFGGVSSTGGSTRRSSPTSPASATSRRSAEHRFQRHPPRRGDPLERLPDLVVRGGGAGRDADRQGPGGKP